MCFAFMILWISLCLALCPGAAILGAIDYKKTFARTYGSDDEVMEAYSQCHARSAKRVLKALLANGGVSQSVDRQLVRSVLELCLLAGVFIKMGQHMASL